MAAIIQFSAQGHRVSLSRDSLSFHAVSSGPRRKLGAGTYLRPVRWKVGSANWRRSALRVCCETEVSGVAEKDEAVGEGEVGSVSDLSVVMKFGGSSVATADRMREVAELILSFPEERPVIVLSAMGKTTNNLLLAGEKAVSCGVSNASDIAELKFVKQLHLKTVNELEIEGSIISGLLDELEQLLKGIAMMKELTPRTRDYLVSFGECMSTRIFAEYLNKTGIKARCRKAIIGSECSLENIFLTMKFIPNAS